MRLVKAITLAASIVAVLAGSVPAQELAGRIGLSAQAGMLYPIGDFNSKSMPEDPEDIPAGFANRGAGLGASMDYFLTEQLAVGVNFMYNRFGLDLRLVEKFAPGQIHKGHFRAVAFGFSARYSLLPERPVRPYAKAGILFAKTEGEGTVFWSGEDRDMTIDIDLVMGTEAAVGAMYEVALSRFLFGEIGYSYLLSDGTDIRFDAPGVPMESDELGFNAQWLSARAGLMFFFGK
jgi:opacity protein-like surface antigen